jgi:hypothetical protein
MRSTPINDHSTAHDLRAKVFEDRQIPRNWRVGKMDEDGDHEVMKVFTGPDAREQAIRRARIRHVFAVTRIQIGAWRTDAWLVEYNYRRPHQGRWCFGKTPMQTFLDAIPLAKEKIMVA